MPRIRIPHPARIRGRAGTAAAAGSAGSEDAESGGTELQVAYTAIDADACDGTDVGAACASTCSAGYTGGSVTCAFDGTFTVVACVENGHHRLLQQQGFLMERLGLSQDQCTWDEVDDIASDVTMVCCSGTTLYTPSSDWADDLTR